MTDQEKMQQLFTELGIPFEVILQEGSAKESLYNSMISIEQGCGYNGFLCEFYFLDGKFQKHGVFE